MQHLTFPARLIAMPEKQIVTTQAVLDSVGSTLRSKALYQYKELSDMAIKNARDIFQFIVTQALLPVFTVVLLFGGCVSQIPSGASLIFSRDDSTPSQISVRLRWSPNTGPPFYTPRGPMREITILEAGRSVSVPPKEISAIEDLWPERVGLTSTRPGDYDLKLPSGVGEGSLTLVRVRDFRVISVQDVPVAQPTL